MGQLEEPPTTRMKLFVIGYVFGLEGCYKPCAGKNEDDCCDANDGKKINHGKPAKCLVDFTCVGGNPVVSRRAVLKDDFEADALEVNVDEIPVAWEQNGQWGGS